MSNTMVSIMCTFYWICADFSKSQLQ